MSIKPFAPEHFPVVLAGNCNTSVGVAAALKPKYLDVVYFDAHADLDTPDETVSGYFYGMRVSMLAGQSWRALMKTIPDHEILPLHRFVYCGVRDVSWRQRKKLEEGPAQVVDSGGRERANLPLELGEAVDRVYLPKRSSIMTWIAWTPQSAKPMSTRRRAAFKRPTCTIVSSSCQRRSSPWL